MSTANPSAGLGRARLTHEDVLRAVGEVSGRPLALLDAPLPGPTGAPAVP